MFGVTPACMRRQPILAAIMAVWLLVAFATSASAQARPVRTGAVEGVVSTQNGTIQLGGVAVVVRNASDVEVVTHATEADGHYRVQDLPAGTYRVVFSLEGFVTKSFPAVVVAGQTMRLDVDLAIASVAANVTVVAPAIVSSAGTLSTTDAVAGQEVEKLSPGGGVSGALRLLASVIEVPGGLSIKGGRPNQAGMQIGASMFTDPSLGLAHINLPPDAIDSVSVLPNPYAVEYGRFSSGLVVIQTRRAADMWKVRLNNLDPTFRTERYKDWKVTGIAGFGPRVELGGPLIKDRLFLEQTAQYRYSTDDIPSRPENERRTTNWLSSFTRVDANLSSRHTLTATGGLFPKVTTYASLGTFTPPEATVDVHDRVAHITGTERVIWSDHLVSESTMQIDQYKTSMLPQGSAPMELARHDAGQLLQHTGTTPGALQLVETLSGTYDGPSGRISSKSAPTAADGLHRIEREPAGAHLPGGRHAGPAAGLRGADDPGRNSTDLALFAQDRAASPRRAGTSSTVRAWTGTASPIAGSDAACWCAVLLNESGTSVSARRLRPLLRTNPVGCRAPSAVRNDHRQPVRRGRRHAARGAGCLHSCTHGARSGDRAQRDVGPGL